MKKTMGEEKPSPAGDRETRLRILEVAQQLFLARGYKGVSMKDLAEQVQVTSAALYYHFSGGKQDLFVSVIQRMLEAWTQGAVLATGSAQGLQERLTNLTQYLLTLPIDCFSTLSRDIHENMLDHGTKRKELLQFQEMFLQHATNLFQEAIDTGEITQEIPAIVLAAMYEGMSISLLRNKHIGMKTIVDLDPKQLADFVVSALLKGIIRGETLIGANLKVQT